MNLGVRRVLRIARNVADLQHAVDFYCGALGFCRVDEGRVVTRPGWARLPGTAAVAVRAARLRLGEQEIELAEFDPPGAPYPASSTSCDLWFQHCAIVTDDMAAAHEHVMRYGAMPITRDGPQVLPPSTGGVTAFKFRDPDGHPLELLHFPPGTGDSRWQRPDRKRAAATLGIDHTAISVADSERSLVFYEMLGFRKISRQINQGAEQRRLDALDDVRVDVVALQPGSSRTPHVELLGYRHPRGRAANGMNLRDIAADRTVLEVGDVVAALDVLRAADAQIVISGSRMALLRDPDGHLLELTGPA